MKKYVFIGSPGKSCKFVLRTVLPFTTVLNRSSQLNQIMKTRTYLWRSVSNVVFRHTCCSVFTFVTPPFCYSMLSTKKCIVIEQV